MSVRNVPLRAAVCVVPRGGAKYLKTGFEFSECVGKARLDEIVHSEDSG